MRIRIQGFDNQLCKILHAFKKRFFVKNCIFLSLCLHKDSIFVVVLARLDPDPDSMRE
jgi:hypothetical protein